jgi:hypothetical protein
MAEYNPGLLMMQIGEQLDKFTDRVTVLVDAVQLLHHKWLAIDLLIPEQMAILHQSVQEKAQAKALVLWQQSHQTTTKWRPHMLEMTRTSSSFRMYLVPKKLIF